MYALLEGKTLLREDLRAVRLCSQSLTLVPAARTSGFLKLAD